VSLHPQAKQFFEYAASMGQPELHQLDVEQARALVDSAAGLIGPGPDCRLGPGRVDPRPRR
jgi:hypothetical protein